MRDSDTDLMDEIMKELDKFSPDRLPWVKKQWIYNMNASDFPFGAKVAAIYMVGIACDLAMQKKRHIPPEERQIERQFQDTDSPPQYTQKVRNENLTEEEIK